MSAQPELDLRNQRDDHPCLVYLHAISLVAQPKRHDVSAQPEFDLRRVRRAERRGPRPEEDVDLRLQLREPPGKARLSSGHCGSRTDPAQPKWRWPRRGLPSLTCSARIHRKPAAAASSPASTSRLPTRSLVPHVRPARAEVSRGTEETIRPARSTRAVSSL